MHTSALFCRPIFNWLRLIRLLPFFEDVAVAMFHGKEPKDDQARKSWEPVDAVANTRQCWQASTFEVASLRDAVAKLERGRCK